MLADLCLGAGLIVIGYALFLLWGPIAVLLYVGIVLVIAGHNS